MIGLRAGIAVGLRAGIAAGISADPTGGATLAGVAQDATRGIYTPASAAQWTQVLSVVNVNTGNPSSLYLLQEASGNAADSIGAITLTASGTLAYRQSITGWSTKGISTTAGVAGILSSTAAALPDIGTTSCALLAYVLLPAGVATLRTVAQLGSAFNTEASAEISGVPKSMILQADPNTATGAADNTNIVRPIWITVNRTSGKAILSTDLEELQVALVSPTGKLYALGGDNLATNFPDNCAYLYAARFDGAAAETTTAQRRAVLQVLGWTPPW